MTIFIIIYCLLLSIKAHDTVFIQSLDYLKIIEESIKTIADNLNLSFASLCAAEAECLPSYNSCSNILPNLACSPEFLFSQCEQEPSRQVNLTTTVVKLANKYIPIDDDEQTVKEMICFSEFLWKDFNAMRKNNTGVKWQYFGSYNGVMRSYPGKGRCGYYDHRTTNWYISSLLGSKRVSLGSSFSCFTSSPVKRLTKTGIPFHTI